MNSFSSAQTLDIPYARKVLEHLIAHPEEHEQAHIGQRNRCGTTACIAGTAVLMDSASTISWGKSGDLARVHVNGRYHAVSIRAEELLGLNDKDAHYLFFDEKSMNNDAALELLADYIAQAETAQAAP